MDIHVPKNLTYQETKKFVGQHCKQSFNSEDSECNFHWAGVEWADLPELVSILNWSTKLIQRGKNVTWTFAHPLSPIPEIDDLRYLARLALGEDDYQRMLSRIRRLERKLMQGQLNPRTRKDVLSRIQSEVESRGKSIASSAIQWLNAETLSFRYADMLAYLDRYDFFIQALKAGIAVTPDPRQIPKSLVMKKPDTPSLELQPVHSWIEVDTLLERLSSSEELSRILGDYANLDIVRRGALAQILVTELGRNIGEHSRATNAWICTRLVRGEHTKIQTEGDPVLASFRESQEGFLEVIICDNGDGLTKGLENVLDRDQRVSVRGKYEFGHGKRFSEHDLIDYAFDRLSSVKRDIVELVHLFDKSGFETGKVASGLYWVWNVARSHCGILSVRTGKTCGWYDFTVSGKGIMQPWEQTSLKVDPFSTPFYGTMIRICLPLIETHRDSLNQKRYLWKRKKRNGSLADSQDSSPRTRIVWVGDLARRVRPLSLNAPTKKTNVGQMHMFEDDYRIRLLRELQREHFPLRDGDMLVFDLCGLQFRWAMDSVNPLCHFVAEMNYTSTVGRSAVVLWNVPTQEGELFEKGMEDAIGTYSHLQGFRRAVFLVWDNGQVRFFCGWSEAERILGTLGIEGELHLDEMGLNTLSEEDQGRFRKLVSENSHLLEWTAPDRVRMRPWPPNLNMESWQQGIRWFNHLTTASVQHGGVLNTLDLVGHYYRLPSTGLLVKNFYQFDVVLFNQQACARIVWLLAQIISVIEQQGEKVQWIVSVTRPMISLARDLVNNYHLYNRAQAPRFLARSTVEELEESREEIATGPAIILTDVISSGSLCKQIQVALPEVKWLGILALLDTRDITFDESIEEQALQIIPGWEPQKIHDIELGDVYSLSRKRVEKLHPAKVKVKHVIPIDKVNICPAEFPDQRDTRKREIWPFLKYDGKALKIGHYQAENYHHYIYYINALQLLDTTDPNDGESLRQFIAKSVVDDLNKINCDPDKAVLIHPPREVSYAEEIAKEIQRHTGILNRLILYRDSFAGHWRFSPFVQRGVRFGGYTAVLIDDGSNTGETLIGLLDAASFGQPFRILAYICITRMPLHKADLLSRLNGLKGISSEVKVQFMVSFNIPVYSQRTCPICRFRRGLSEVSTASSVFSPFAGAMREETEANKAGSHAGTEDSLSLWKYTTPLGVARLREQIELVDYEAQSALAVDEILKKAAKLPTTVSDDNDSLLDLAFILCTEPDLSESAMFAPYLADLLQHTFARIKACHEDNLMTYVGLAYELMFHLQRRSGSDFQQHLTGFWRAIFGRTQLKVGGLSRVVTFMLARALAERGIESEPHVGLCRVLAKQLLRHVSSRTDRRFEEKNILVWGSGRLFAHEIMATLEGSGHLLGFALDLDHSDLLSVAISAAAKFWRHASIHVTDPISRLANASSYSNDTVRGLTEAAIRELLEGFYKLHQLQHTLCDIERSLSISRGQSPGACLYWGHPNMTSAIDGYGQALIQVAEAVETSTDITDKIENLKEAWQSLQPYLTAAFDDIFPVVSEIFDERWSEWDSISHLPAQAARPLDMARRLDRERVFMPRMLLSRFFTVTMENLKTAAFKAWSKAQIIKEGYARVSILKEQSDGQSIICVRVSDNGSRHSKNSSTFSKHSHKKKTGRGLSDISEMVKSFGGEIKGPCISEQETVIELRMRHVILGRQQRIER